MVKSSAVTESKICCCRFARSFLWTVLYDYVCGAISTDQGQTPHTAAPDLDHSFKSSTLPWYTSYRMKYYACGKESRYMQYTYQHVIFTQSSSFSVSQYISLFFNERWCSGVFCVYVIPFKIYNVTTSNTCVFSSMTNSMSRVIAWENHAPSEPFVENQWPWKFVN